MNDIAYHIITTEIIMERSECYSYISFVALWVFILKIFDIYSYFIIQLYQKYN